MASVARAKGELPLLRSVRKLRFPYRKVEPGPRVPDLFILGQPTPFDGFFPGVSKLPLGHTWTWLVLKAHTTNTAGTVTLRSTDPRKMPEASNFLKKSLRAQKRRPSSVGVALIVSPLVK
jgi:hypothetical protein